MDEPEPVGYVVALPPECRTLTRQRTRRGDLLALDARHRVAVAGAGSDNATAAAAVLVAAGARRLVSWGCAAALTDDLRPGQLVMPREFVYADGAAVQFATPWHERLVHRLQAILPIRTEPMAESTGIVASAAAKRRLHAATGAIATDMETGAVARAAQRCGIPCLTVRSIVDAASVTIPRAAQAALDGHGEIVIARLLLQLARHPSELGALVRLSRAFRSALQSLAVVAAHAGPGLDPR